MLSCLTEDHVSMTKAKAYVDHILASQDADGYIGIFSPELRYGGNGEFWTQTCLFRGLLAYADALADQRVYEAVKRAVDRTMEGYAGGKNFHFAQHDALYTEVLEQLYAKTGDKKYLDFGLRIYHERPNLLQFHQQPLVGKNFQNCYELGHGATVGGQTRGGWAEDTLLDSRRNVDADTTSHDGQIAVTVQVRYRIQYNNPMASIYTYTGV